MTLEQKAKAYDEAIERAKSAIKECGDNMGRIKMIESIFELKEDNDERIRKVIYGWIYTQPSEFFDNGFSKEEMLAWLEKQGKIDKESYEIAEKEKYDFVSGQFIECRKSFNEFKEDNSYWFEYIGNDNYIGRSDNILNQTFHITPRQLFTLFTAEHCPKNDENDEYKENEDEQSKKWILEYLYDGLRKSDEQFKGQFKAAIAWLEKQGEQKWTDEDEKMFEEYKLGIQALMKDAYVEKFCNWIFSLKQRLQ